MKKGSRQSNYELMRIISMMMIVIWHVFLYGSNIDSAPDNIKMIYDLIRSILVVHVNSFVILSGYFQCKSKFKMSKLLSLINSVAFYKIFILTLVFIFGFSSVSKVSIIRNVFPLDLESYWFIRVYLILYIISPFLNKFIATLSKHEYRKLLIVLFTLFSVISTFTNQEALSNTVNYGYSLVSFVFLYLLGAYFRIYPFSDTYFGKRFSKNAQQLMFIFIFFALAFINFSTHVVFTKLLSGGEIASYIGRTYSVAFNQYDNPLVVLQSLSYFMIFGYLNLKSRLINVISSTTFGIYLIHENIFLRYNMYRIFKFPAVAVSKMVFVRVFLVTIIIFTICFIIDFIRQKLFKKIYDLKLSKRFRNRFCLYVDSLGIKINW